jgi:hypothetical protein
MCALVSEMGQRHYSSKPRASAKSNQIQNLARSSTRNDGRCAQTRTSANGGSLPLPSLGFFAQGAHQIIKNWISMSKINRGLHHQKKMPASKKIIHVKLHFLAFLVIEYPLQIYKEIIYKNWGYIFHF